MGAVVKVPVACVTVWPSGSVNVYVVGGSPPAHCAVSTVVWPTKTGFGFAVSVHPDGAAATTETLVVAVACPPGLLARTV